jgi:uncharacterized membrane protein
MAKHSQQNRLAKARNGEILLEQSNAFDDSLLPSAEELEKLKEVDPNIVKWIMDRTEMEQNARLDFNKNRIKLSEYDLRKTHRFNFTALTFGFIIFMAILAISAFFVYYGLPITGTIFGGTAILVGAIYFIKASIAHNQSNK